MATFSETFHQWTDFPKGLRILLVDSDTQFLQDITCKLQSYHYFVTSFSSGEEACVALASHTQTFHVALVEATENNGVVDSFKLLSFAKDVPTIMMSVMENMSMMVKSIALGAVEFLLKPPTDDKLKNIWQHVVRKALDSSRDSLRPGYLEPGKPTISLSAVSEDHQSCSKEESNISNAEKSHCEGGGTSHSLIISVEKSAALSTPQLEQGGQMTLQEAAFNESPRSHDSSEVCNYKERHERQNDADNLSCSTMSADIKEEEKEILLDNVATEEEVKAVDKQAQIFCCSIPMLESALHIEDADAAQTMDTKALASEIRREGEGLVMVGTNCGSKMTTEVSEVSSTEGYEPQHPCKSTVSLSETSKDSVECPNTDSTCQSETLRQYHGKNGSNDEGKRKPNDLETEGKEAKCSKKKFKVDWTADLHRRFVQAVEHLGVEQAIPSRILEVMKVDGLTRHNVASHLQKYRSQKKHVYAREEANTWHQNKYNYGRPWNRAGQNINHMWVQPHPPVFCQPLHVWGHPKVEAPAMHVLPQYVTGSNCWLAFDNLVLRHPLPDSCVPGVPSMAPCYLPHMKVFAFPQKEVSRNATWETFADDAENSTSESKNRSSKFQLEELYPPKELLDAAISEALSNPWTPLPLGLKPPSMESVMAELQRQGINTLSSIS